MVNDLLSLTRPDIIKEIHSAYFKAGADINGVVKRSDVDQMIKLISAEERKKLWGMGIKIGRYHIYLPKMLKPKAVTFRISLWQLFYKLPNIQTIPKFGLNFVSGKNFDKKFFHFVDLKILKIIL